MSRVLDLAVAEEEQEDWGQCDIVPSLTRKGEGDLGYSWVNGRHGGGTDDDVVLQDVKVYSWMILQ